MRKFIASRALLPAALALSLAACAVGPDFVRPETPVDPVFAATATEGAGYRAEEPELAYWRAFGDPLLERLVRETLASNHDLRIAFARLNQARALARQARLDYFPTVPFSASYADVRTAPAQLGIPALTDPIDRETYDAGFDFSWEIDLFGRVRRANEAARADSAAAGADLDAARVSVVAELARSYFELRGLQEQLRVARENVGNQDDSLKVVNVRLEAGRGTEFDTARQRAQLATTQARVPALEAAVAATEHRIAVLTGRSPTALHDELSAPAALPEWPSEIQVGSPESLLRRRPDIAAAEARLASATARIGVATADLFPRVSLVGRYGSSASEFEGLGESLAENWSIGPSISWAAFDLGRVRARIDANDANTEAALASYEQTVLRALEETETALVRFDRKRRETGHLASASDASGDAARLARLRFDGGVADFLQVLDAERTALDARDRLAQARTETATALIAVYKALGGFPDPAQESTAVLLEE